MNTIEEVLLPDVGGEEVDIIEISFEVGDVCEEDDGLIVVETEKASMDIPAPFAGEIVEIFVKVGEKAVEGTALMKIARKELIIKEVIEEEVSTKEMTEPTIEVEKEVIAKTIEELSAPSLTKKVGIMYASPSVRRLAYEYGVALEEVEGSARKGRIVKDDVRKYIKNRLSNATENNGNIRFNLPELKEIDFSQFGATERLDLTKIQKISGSSLHRNWISIPHVTQFDASDITSLEAFRQEQNSIAEGFKLSLLVFVVKAVAKALELHPRFNSSLSSNGQELILKKYFHIAIAVDTPNGLVVPVIRDVDKKGFKEIYENIHELSQKARDGKLKIQEMQGASFSISSLGGIGGTNFTPIINAPEVAILGLSKAQIKPKWDGKEFKPSLMLPLALSYDHRVIDGADGVRFTSTLSKLLGDIRLLSL